MWLVFDEDPAWLWSLLRDTPALTFHRLLELFGSLYV